MLFNGFGFKGLLVTKLTLLPPAARGICDQYGRRTQAEKRWHIETTLRVDSVADFVFRQETGVWESFSFSIFYR